MELRGEAVRTHVKLSSVSRLVNGDHDNPFAVLGPHEIEYEGRRAMAVRAFLPDRNQAWVWQPAYQTSHPMRRIHPAGLFEAICPFPVEEPRYQLRVSGPNGEVTTMHDPYSFAPLMTEFDLYLFGEGSNVNIYEKMGAHVREIDGVRGVNFAVWAPNASAVSLVGDFNHWDGRSHPMRKLIPSGVWELFVPETAAGVKYKFRVKTATGEVMDKTDPFGFAAEIPPRTASIVSDLNQYQWNDRDWIERRKQSQPLKEPHSVYEVHLGSWKRNASSDTGWMNYRDLAHELVDYCKQVGYTHLELMPISEHPFTGSWGYQTVGYFATTSRYGTPEDFMYFVDHCHQHGIGVIIDWVPAHFPKDGHGLRRFDGTALYEHDDPRQGEHPDWGTLIFNYGRNEIRNFLISNAMFWLDKFHIDGLRVDAVASMLYLDYSREDGEWIPNREGGRENLEAIEFLKEFNEKVHGEYPGVLTIAEESTAWTGVSRPVYTGGLGFTFKWNMGWMNDTLRYMRNEPIHRKYHHDELTFSLIYAFTENFMLPLSHDEVVHGKGALLDQMPGDQWQRFANLRLLYSYMWTHPGKKLLFMGGDIAQWDEWNEEKEIPWNLLQFDNHRGIQNLVSDLNQMIRREKALHEVDFEPQGFEWIDCMSRDDSVLAYIRRAEDPSDFLVVCCNFTPVCRNGHCVGVPESGFYQEIFNSDSSRYGGSNVGTHPGAQSIKQTTHARPDSIVIDLPPLGISVFKPQR